MQLGAVIGETVQDWAAAREVQQRLMRPAAPEPFGADCAVNCRQAHELGGDFYGLAPLDHDRVAITLGDASGKGLPAALMSSSVQSSLRTALLFTDGDAAATLSIVNPYIHEISPDDRYVTLFHAIFDKRTRELRYVNAGHVPPAIVRRDGLVELLESGGRPVGLFGDSIYEEDGVTLEPGDILIACTDGVIEQENPAGGMFECDSLLEIVLKHRRAPAAKIVHEVFRALDDFSGRPLADDATLLILKA